MTNFFKSAVQFCWTMSDHALGQAGHLVAAILPAPVITAARQHRSTTSSKIPDREPNHIVRPFLRAALGATRHSLRLMELATPSDSWSLRWRELENKLDAFSLFEHVDLELGLASTGERSLRDMVYRAEALGPYSSVWAVEGVGHYQADSHLARHGDFNGILPESLLRDLPQSSLVPLHAGAGLALAGSLLAQIDKLERSAAAGTISRFISRCQDSFRPQYLEIIYEALGLATRNLHPHLLSTMHLCLSGLSRDLPDYFWHGVGRALYFAPSALAPLAKPWHAFEVCITEPPDSAARRNAVAGFAWALTLVNVRHPRIMAAFLRRHGTRMTEEAAFSDGVSSGLIIWAHSSSHARDLDVWRDFRPDPNDPQLGHLWEKHIIAACANASSCPVDHSEHLAKLFRYRGNMPFPDREVVHPGENNEVAENTGKQLERTIE